MKLKRKKKIDYRYYIYFAILTVCVVLAVFVYKQSCVRIWQNLYTATDFYSCKGVQALRNGEYQNYRADFGRHIKFFTFYDRINAVKFTKTYLKVT